MPRKTPDEIFAVTKKYEPNRQAEIKALQVVLEINKKRRQEQRNIPKNEEAI